MYVLGSTLKKRTDDKTKRLAISNVINIPVRMGADEVICDAVVARAVLLCLVPSALMFFLVPEPFTRFGAPAPSLNWTTGWYLTFLLVLGVAGSCAKTWFVVPLQPLRLDMGAVPPVMAGRQLIYFGAAYLVAWFVPLVANCAGLECVVSGNVINLDILPRGRSTYWIGITIVVLIWIFSWAWFSWIGFFKGKLESRH